MKLAKCLLVALALWMPLNSFAAAAASCRVEQAQAAEESSEESSDSRAEQELLLPSCVALSGRSATHTVDGHVHHQLDGHIAELHVPPPNPA